jgi:hypothetical protein
MGGRAIGDDGYAAGRDELAGNQQRRHRRTGDAAADDDDVEVAGR